MDVKAWFNYDKGAPLNIVERGSEERDGVNIRDISFSNSLGGVVEAYVVAPSTGDGAPAAPSAGVLFVHWLEPRDEDTNRAQFVDEAVTLAKKGVVSVLPDGFWSTTPEKWKTERPRWWRTEFDHDRKLSIHQVIELRRALDVLLSQSGVDAERIAYVGHDFGAMYGALVSSVDRRPKAYVLTAGTCAFSRWFIFGSQMSDAERQAYAKQMEPLDPARFVADAAPAALYFQFADNDSYVPEADAKIFYEAASEPKSISWYHADHSVKDKEYNARHDRLAWVEEQLGL